jgi:hypothetical protein
MIKVLILVVLSDCERAIVGNTVEGAGLENGEMKEEERFEKNKQRERRGGR